MKAFSRSALIFAFFCLSACACLGLLQIEHWFFQLFSHFMLQYVWLFILFGLFFFLTKKKVFAILSILFAVILFSKIWPSQIVTASSPKTQSEFSILSINLLSSNNDSKKVNQLIEDKDADVLLLIEYTSFWDKNALTTEYPYSIIEPREDNFGIALYSKLPLTDGTILDFTNSRFPMTAAKIEVGNLKVDILGLHYENPIGRHQTKVQKFQIQETISYTQSKQNVIVIGDFNLTPYTKDFSNLLHQANLRDSRVGFGIQGSWPSLWTPFRIPIDHALVSKNIKVKYREIGPSVGSDHLPLYLQIQL